MGIPGMKELALSPAHSKILLFILLGILMVLSATLLLETVCYTAYDLRGSEPSIESLSESITLRFRGGEPLSWPHLLYRYSISIALLVLAYHCLALQAWARYGLIGALGLDMGIWFLHALRYILTQTDFTLAREQILLEILVVFFEGFLLWLLCHPNVIGHFANRAERSKIAPLWKSHP